MNYYNLARQFLFVYIGHEILLLIPGIALETLTKSDFRRKNLCFLGHPPKIFFAEMCRWFFSQTSFTSWVNITMFKGCSFNIPTYHLYINSSCWYLLPYHLTWLRNQVQWGLIGRRCGVFGWFSYLVCWDWFGKNDSFMSLKCLNVFFSDTRCFI